MAGGKPRHNRSGRQPPTSSRGAVVVSDWRGAIRVSKWPRKRGKPTHPAVLWWNEWFRQANILAKYAPAEFQSTARRATSQSALMPRDVMIMAMRGRLFTFEIEGLGTVYSVAGRQDVSTALDLIGKQPGSLLYRSPEMWVPVPIGSAGQVLTVGANLAPEWQPPSGGGGGVYSPPTTETLPYEVNADGMTVVNSAYGSMTIGRPKNGTLPRWGGRFQTYPAVLADTIAGLHCVQDDQTELWFGIAAYNSASGRWLLNGVYWGDNQTNPKMSVELASTNGSGITQEGLSGLRLPSPVFFGWRDEGSTLLSLYGNQPDAMQGAYRVNKADLQGDPTHYGIYLGWGTASTSRNGQQLSCIHWSRTLNG